MSKSVVSAPFIRSAYNYDTMAVSDETGLKCEDPSLTVQSSKDECDINIMLENMARGVLPVENPRIPQYGDFSTSASDYHTALNMVLAARESFDSLPAKIRARFDNDPAQMLSFLDDPDNRSEAIELGLISSPSEDLSIPPAARNTNSAVAEGGVGKSGPQVKLSKKGFSGIPEGYRLVPDTQGGNEGDD